MKHTLLSITILLCSHFNGYSQFKEEKVSSLRSQVILNGIWDFQPADEKPNTKPVDDWGQIRVPGSWDNFNGDSWGNTPGLTAKGKTQVWSADLKKASKAWYKQSVLVPASWKGRAVEIELEKVSTDAVIYINGNQCGIINWYTGKVDISKFVNYGKQNEILILVIATPDQGELPRLMGTADSQVSFSKSHLASRGITGNVSLLARPSTLHISDVFVKPSVRKKLIETEIELQGVKKGETLEFTSNVYKDGLLKKTFKQTVTATGASSQIVDLQSKWSNPELWDLQKPNLYQLHTIVSSKGKKIDEYVQTFGFREFWIEGKDFFLNGTRINLRPLLGVPGNGMHHVIEHGIDGLLKNGYNFSELWPENFDERGSNHDWNDVMHVADKKGYLLTGTVLPFNFYIMGNGWSYQWDKPGVKEKWQNRMLIELKRMRNHPSVVLWATAANFFGHADDQNPRNIGQVGWVKDNPFFQKNAAAGMEAIKVIKSFDPTRPVYTHHGTYVGDVHTLNFYLNLIPLQEREEWMSQFSQSGKIPFIGIEFGTPFFCTFLRGRNGYGNAIQTEPLATEFSAMYGGNKAYQTETNEYRNLIKNSFVSEQKYKGYGPSPELTNLPAYQELQYLFSKNTLRSWRTWGVSGGFIPWDKGYGWRSIPEGNAKVKLPPFQPGQKGNYFREAPAHVMNYLQPGGSQITPAGVAMTENVNELLAYIAGPQEAFTAKDHHFKPLDEIKKQFIFFNDTRSPQEFSWQAKLLVGGQEMKGGSGSFTIPVADKKVIAYNFTLPNSQSAFRQDGQIILSTKVNNRTLQDTFNFRVFKNEPLKKKTITVYDPQGETSEMLSSLGYTVSNWDGRSQFSTLVIGKNALVSNASFIENLEKFIVNGGKVLLMNQHPDSLSTKRGFRVSPYISRNVFPVNAKHDLFQNLDEKDLRNWTGESKLIEAYPDYSKYTGKRGANDVPVHGWHWGNRGGVATGAIEKPHRTAWRPLLECEFDMAWTPLMELPYGKGHLISNNLDLEDHYKNDVIAAMMSERLVTYLDTLTTNPRSTNTTLLGDEKDKVFLTDLGLNFEKSNKISKSTGLLIVGNINKDQEAAVLNFAKNGGKVVVLPRNSSDSFLGVAYSNAEISGGGTQIPNWPQAEGLSQSDVRYRVDYNITVLKLGCETGMNGLLGRKAIGKGLILFSQFDPNRFKADSLTYFRFTRWRQTRALSQVLSNMGASFVMDRSFFNYKPERSYSVGVDGMWKAVVTKSLPAVKNVNDKYKDPGITAEALAYVKEDANESKMVEVQSGIVFEKANEDWNELDGELVYRKTVQIPEWMQNEDLTLNLGLVDDYDDVYFNGVLIGRTDVTTPDTWSLSRSYTIPAKLIKKKDNVIAVRLFDGFGGGGLTGGNKKREIVPVKERKIQTYYHPDYIDRFDIGDDPFRYFRW
jgi:beta-galactosidase